MVSELKSETARINGARSHGPKTPDGKQKSSQNALKHGGASTRGILLACESPDEYQNLHDSYLVTHAPVGPAEIALVEQMAAARWRILRLDGIEVGLLDDEMARQETAQPAADPGSLVARAFRALADESRSLALASRYQSRQHRIHDHAYKTLRELQQARLSQEPEGKLEIGWITPDERRARDHARGLMYAHFDNSSAPALPNEPTAAASKEVTEPLAEPPTLHPV